MNEKAHADIFTTAFHALPLKYRRQLKVPAKLLYDAGNYPDYFDDPTRPEANKLAIDPEWRKYCRLDDAFGIDGQHFWKTPVTEPLLKIELIEYYMKQMLACLQQNDAPGFVKFAGCLSHFLGDITQPAHLSMDPNNAMTAQFLPVPPRKHLKNFHYHTTVEAVYCPCGKVGRLEMLGANPREAAWMLAEQCMLAVSHCRRYLIPMILAIFDNNIDKAESLVKEPMTIAARLTAQSMYTILKIHDQSAIGQTGAAIDLRLLPCFAEEHDLVYGGKILDGNKDIPPNNAPVTPGTLLIDGQPQTLKGFGMLPASGMRGDRVAWSSWLLPAGVFAAFTCRCGVNHAIAGDGAVEFVVELDHVQVASTGRLTRLNDSVTLNVPLGNAKLLTLKVKDANNGATFWKNHGYWANALLNRSQTT